MNAKRPALKKSRGQHFLISDAIPRRMVELLELTSSDRILEIGPGAGALTLRLEEAPHALLLLLEKDDYWARERQKTASSRTQCVLTDALTFDFSRLKARTAQDEAWTIVGNPPYNVASPLIWEIAEKATIKQALFMVQAEVGERLTAQPSCKQYGALSVWVQSYLLPRFCWKVAPQAFQPRPKVDSAVIAFHPKPDRLADDLARPLKRLLDLCFQKRRKQLLGILRRAGLPDVEDILDRLGIRATQRPEELSVHDFQHLAAFFRDKGL